MAKGTIGQKEIRGSMNPTLEVESDAQDEDEVGNDDGKVQRTQFH
jgi:hypothetical protein